MKVINIGSVGYTIYYFVTTDQELQTLKLSYEGLARELMISKTELNIARTELEKKDLREIQINSRETTVAKDLNTFEKQISWLSMNKKEIISASIAPEHTQYGQLFVTFYKWGTLTDLREFLSASEFNKILAHPDTALVVTFKPKREVNKAKDWTIGKDNTHVIHTLDRFVFYIENGVVYREPMV
jgi:hypothetical protein